MLGTTRRNAGDAVVRVHAVFCAAISGAAFAISSTCTSVLRCLPSFKWDDQVRSAASSLRTCKGRLAHGTGYVSSNCSWHAPATGRAPDPTSRRPGSRSMRCLRVVMRTRVSELAAVCSREKFVVGRTLRAGFSFFLPSSVSHNVEIFTWSVHCWISVCGFFWRTLLHTNHNEMFCYLGFFVFFLHLSKSCLYYDEQ